MTKRENNGFTPEELVILADSANQIALFGFPELAFYRMSGAESISLGEKRLKEKGMLDEQGHLTKKGYAVVYTVERYGEADTFFSLNESYVTCEEQACRCLHKTPGGNYQIEVVSSNDLLARWMTQFQLVRREALEEELQFREKPSDLNALSKEELVALTIPEVVELKQIIRRETMVEKTARTLFLNENKLYSIQNKQVVRLSQYWLSKWLVDHLQIPYEKPKKEVKRYVF